MHGWIYYIFKSLMKFSTFGSDPEKNNVANLPFDFNMNRKIPALNFISSNILSLPLILNLDRKNLLLVFYFWK